MNQPEDILNMTNFENLPDYTIFKKKAPSLKRYPSSARKTLNRWYISFVKNNNPLIKFKYWISVNGYLENNNLIQSSPILNIDGPFVVLTANTKYFLVGNSDILKNPPHSRFDLTELSKFSNGFPFDWKEIIEQQLVDIFGTCRLRNTTVENDNLLSPFDKVYKELFGNEDTNFEINKVMKYNANISDLTKQTKSDENLPLEQNNEDSLLLKKLHKNDLSIMQDSSMKSQITKATNKHESRINNSYSSFMQDSSMKSQITKATNKNESSNIQDSSIRSQITKATLNSQTKNEEDFNKSKSSEEIEIIFKSVKDDCPSNIFLDDNINKIFNIPEKKSPSNFTDNDILSISSKLLEKEGKSFENVMSVINKQKRNTKKNEIKKGKSDISELFTNSSFNVQGNFTDNNKTDNFHEEDYLQDSKIIENIFNLGNVIENSSFIPNDSDKVNLSLLNRKKKGDTLNKKKGKDNNSEKSLALDEKSTKSLLKENKSQFDEKSNKSLLEEFMNSRLRKPYPYEETNNSKISKKKKVNEQSNIKDEQSNIKDEQSNIKDEQSNIKDDQSNTKDEQSNLKDEQSNLKDEQSNLKDEQSNLKDEQSNIKDEQSNTSFNIEKEINNERDQTLENFSNITTVSQKNSNTPKKKKKGRSSLCMPRKVMPKKKPESKN